MSNTYFLSSYIKFIPKYARIPQIYLILRYHIPTLSCNIKKKKKESSKTTGYSPDSSKCLQKKEEHLPRKRLTDSK